MPEVFHRIVCMFDIDNFSNKTNSPSLALRSVTVYKFFDISATPLPTRNSIKTVLRLEQCQTLRLEQFQNLKI